MNDIAKTETASYLAVIERAALDPNVDVDKMGRLMNMARELAHDKARVAFNAAFSQCQAEIGRVAADAHNPQTKSKYASYAALDRVLRPLYTSHGFSLSFDTGEAPQDFIQVIAILRHKDGHSESYKATICADGKGAKGGDVMTKTHAIGSGMAYGMRYLLKMIFNVAVGEDDDDGNSSAGVKIITKEQAADIRSLISTVRGNEDFLLKRFKLRSLEELPAQAALDVVNLCLQKPLATEPEAIRLSVKLKSEFSGNI